MIGMKDNQKSEFLNDVEWENMGSFIADLAKNNESVTDEIITDKSSFKKIKTRRSELTDQTVKIKTKLDNSSKDHRSMSSSEDGNGHYDMLHSDIRSLLDELQEIKKARLNLQTKLNTIR